MPLTLHWNMRKNPHTTTATQIAIAQLALMTGGVGTGGVGAAHARESNATFAVGATVAAVARLDSQSAPTVVRVAAADVERGYIDVEEPTTLVVRSNSPTGFTIDLSSLTPMLAAIEVHGLETVASLGAAGGSLVQRWQGPGSMKLVLRFRLFLVQGIALGQYTWPVRIAVRPLAAA